MKFKIDKSIPFPGEYSDKRVARYPFPDMEVGDSFIVPHLLGDSVKAACATYGSRHGKKFISRKLKEGRRVWRES